MKSRYYKILGLPDGAPLPEIRKQYRKLVMQYHPDKNKSPGAERRFIEIKDAYEILTGKKSAPATLRTTQRRNPASPQTSTNEEEMRKRAAEAQARYRDQKMRENLENELYFRKLTNGFRWKIMKISAVLGIVLSSLMLLDLVLPHHYDLDEITGYNLNPAHGLGGAKVSLIETKNSGNFWIEDMNYTLYHGDHQIWIESSWILHSPMRILSQSKTEMFGYDINFNFFRVTFLIIPLFLTPLFTLWYKRRKISFTVVYFFSLYGVNLLMLYFLFAEHRWAHILSLGFL